MRLVRCGNSYEILFVMDLQDGFFQLFLLVFFRRKNHDSETSRDSETQIQTLRFGNYDRFGNFRSPDSETIPSQKLVHSDSESSAIG